MSSRSSRSSRSSHSLHSEKKPISNVNETKSNHWLRSEFAQLMMGVKSAFVGIWIAWNNHEVRRTQNRSTGSLLAILFLIYVILLLWFLPVYVILNASVYFNLVDDSTVSLIHQKISPTSLLRALLWFIPLTVLYILRTVLGFERLFFVVLKEVDEEEYDRLFQRKVHPFTRELWIFLKRTAIVLFLTLFVQLGRFLPVIGRYMPAVYFLKVSRVLFRHSRYVGIKMIAVLAFLIFGVFGFIPQGEKIGVTLLNLQVASTALSRELLDPFYIRTINKRETIEFQERYGWILIGFGLPFVLLFSIPIVGLFFAGFATGAAANLYSNLIALNQQYNVDHPNRQEDED